MIEITNEVIEDCIKEYIAEGNVIEYLPDEKTIQRWGVSIKWKTVGFRSLTDGWVSLDIFDMIEEII